jgi:hypothetical protein
MDMLEEPCKVDGGFKDKIISSGLKGVNHVSKKKAPLIPPFRCVILDLGQLFGKEK